MVACSVLQRWEQEFAFFFCCILSSDGLTIQQVEIEYVEDDKPSNKQFLCLRAPTSAAAAAVHTAIRDIRSGCSGAASQFGSSCFYVSGPNSF